MRKLIILSLTFVSFFSCNQKSKRGRDIDNFYTYKGEFDLSRFPLIKPYEISTAIPSEDWIIASVDTSEALGTIPGTKYINVVDSVIFAYSKNTILDGQLVSEAWFVIIPDNHVFRGFKHRLEFLSYLSSNKIKEPKMYVVTEVFQYFDSKNSLDWKQLNQSY